VRVSLLVSEKLLPTNNPSAPGCVATKEHVERYFGLLAGLQNLFGCKIGLVETNAIKNPFFLACIAGSRATVYAI
jgi:hypothetical protein